MLNKRERENRYNSATPVVWAPSKAVLMNSKYDNLFKYLSLDTDWSGNVEAPCGAFAKVSLLASDIESEKASLGKPFDHDLLEAIEMLAPGHYLTIQNNDGIIWAWAFDTAADRDIEYGKLDAEFFIWENADEEKV